MKVVWEPWVIIDKRGLFSLLFISDVDLADGTGRRTVISREQFIFVSRQGLYVEVFHHYIAVSSVLSQILMYCDLLANGKWGHPFPPKTC